MSRSVHIVCLAYSRKHHGKCVAGKTLELGGFGAWLRPVGLNGTGEIPAPLCMFEDGTYIKVLDTLRISLLEACPKRYQTENHRLDHTSSIVRTGTMEWKQVVALLDTPESLWKNGSQARFGLNDRVFQCLADTLRSSLVLIEPEGLVLSVHTEDDELFDLRLRVRARFHYRNVEYCLPVTDVRAERNFKQRGKGDYPVTGAYLCISLGEPHTDGYCYKLVAAILTQEPL